MTSTNQKCHRRISTGMKISKEYQTLKETHLQLYSCQCLGQKKGCEQCHGAGIAIKAGPVWLPFAPSVRGVSGHRNDSGPSEGP